MAAKRLSPLTITVIALCAGCAAWISAGALTIVSAQPYAARIGILPSPMWLVPALLAAAIGAIVSRSRSDRLGILALALVLVSPWLPFPVPPAVYVWTGPLRIWLWALVAAAVVLPVLAKRAPRALAAAVADPRRAPWLAAAIAAVVYLAGANRVLPQLPAGDEPHYLVITQSLLLDHDLQIENNHLRGDYHAYYPVDLKPDYRRRGVNNEIYSIHAPGLPVIIAPAFAWFGYPGVLAFLALVSALASGLAWLAAWRVTTDVKATWFGWATVALTAPFFFQSFVAYPDGLGAALVMAGALALTGDGRLSIRQLAWIGLALAVLPWLHTRFVILAISLGALVLIRQLRRPDALKRAAALLAIPVLSAACWFAFFYAIYGTVDPRAPYGGDTQSSLANLPQGIVGLLFDQQFGLLPAAPVFLCGLLGLVTLGRRRPRLTTELLVLAAPYALVVAAFEMWWGGASSPARFLVPVLLPLAIPAAVWFQTRRGPAARLFGLGALAVSLLTTITLAGVDRGALLYNSRDGASRLLLWLSPLVNITTGLPSVFRTGSASALVQAAIWLTAIGLTAAAGVFVERRIAQETTPTRLILALGFSAILTGTAALAIVWRAQPGTPFAVDTGTLALLRQYDPGTGQIAVRSAPLRRMDPAAALAALTLADVTPAARDAATPPALLFHVPAGTYAIEATSTAGVSGHLSATLDRSFGSQWTWDLAMAGAHAFRQEIRLPVEVPALLIDADAAARHSLDRIVLRPVSILGSSHQSVSGEPQHVARYGAVVVYLMSGSAYMEPTGTWIAGGSSAAFVVAPDTSAAGTRVHLFVRNPPIDNVVTLQGDNWRQDLTLAPGEERLLSLPAPSAESGGLSLRITSAHGARPKDFEHGSTDTRLLGCWIETRP